MATTIAKPELLVGKRLRRREDPRLITGTATYVDDIKMPGMLYAVIVRSPHAAATIKSMDISKAASHPGVAAVFTGKDTEKVGPVPCGASLPGLVVLLSKNFIRLAAVAILIATPLAWWAMTKWLQDFIYRADMDWKVYLLAGLLVLSITLITVSVQAIKAAMINPVKNLKVE